jgi:hypothetical protein
MRCLDMASGATALRVVDLPDEDRDIVLWRVDQFRRLGFENDEAWALALSEADLGQARNLGRSGCPADLAFQILA